MPVKTLMMQPNIPKARRSGSSSKLQKPSTMYNVAASPVPVVAAPGGAWTPATLQNCGVLWTLTPLQSEPKWSTVQQNGRYLYANGVRAIWQTRVDILDKAYLFRIVEHTYLQCAAGAAVTESTLLENPNQPCPAPQYLGAPNADGAIGLYASQCAFDVWDIKKVIPNLHVYSVRYAGARFDPADVTLVVARYKEPVRWVWPYRDMTIVYDKSPETPPDHADCRELRRWVQLPNEGREGHTYLHHIIHDYDNLARRVIFSQAEPFVHNPTLLCGIEHYFDHTPVQPMGLQYMNSCNMPPQRLVQMRKVHLRGGLDVLTIRANGDLISQDFIDTGMCGLRSRFVQEQNPFDVSQSLCANLLQNAELRVTNDASVDRDITFTFCGLFSVRQDRIRSKDRHVYEQLMRELVLRDSQGGAVGYILEKFWLFLFSNELT